MGVKSPGNFSRDRTKDLAYPACFEILIRNIAMYVIRSMSTTDANRAEPITPYHLYLLKPEKRIGAYWTSSKFDIATFATIDAALEQARAL
jgi:hypothetical protein